MKCTFIKKDGEPCMANALRGSDFCFAHSPKEAAKRAAARKKGGRNRQTPKGEIHKPYTIKSVEDIMAALTDALNDVCLTENSHSRARSVGYLCQIMLKGLEIGELEKRLEALEQRFKGNGDEPRTQN